MPSKKQWQIVINYQQRPIVIPVQYSRRKSMSIVVKPDLSVTAKAPERVSYRQVQEFVLSKQDWICQKLEEYESTPEPVSQTLPEQEKSRLKKEARRQITAYVERYADLMQASYGRIAIREQKTLWGSCSSKRNLNFNWKLVLMPPRIMEYVVVHELAHLFEMNHSKAFWAIVEQYVPDYQERRRWLRENGNQY